MNVITTTKYYWDLLLPNHLPVVVGSFGLQAEAWLRQNAMHLGPENAATSKNQQVLFENHKNNLNG